MIPETQQETLDSLTTEEKNKLSHQQQILLHYLRTRGKQGATIVELNRLMFRYGGRIFELRYSEANAMKKAYPIKGPIKQTHGLNWYYLDETTGTQMDFLSIPPAQTMQASEQSQGQTL